MSDLSHQDLERWVVEQPLDVVRKLPPSDKRTEVEAHLNEAGKLAHECLETAEKEDRTTALSVEAAREAREAGVAWA